jgi:GT2 family glycosyltransferase
MLLKYPKVVVLILSYNGKHLLYDSIVSYLKNDYENFEVVVIDNGSNDGTYEYVKENWENVKVLRSDVNLNYSGGFNFGLKFAFDGTYEKTDYVLISNNDVLVDRHVISSLVQVAESDNNIGFVSGKVYYYDKPTVIQTVGKLEDKIRWNGAHMGAYEHDTGKYDEISERIFVDDIFALVNRSVYIQLGGYNEKLKFQCEEWDWQARAKNAGFKIYYTPYAKIWHKESMTIGKKSAFKAFFDAKNPILVIFSHKKGVFFIRFIISHFWTHVIKASLSSVIIDRDFFKCIRIWKGFFSGIFEVSYKWK